MAITNYERVGKALEQLKGGLAPFAGREIKAAITAKNLTLEKVRGFVEDPMLAKKPVEDWDVSALLKLMCETWHDVFKKTLGYAEKNLVSEIRNWRNKWAHQKSFSGNDAHRVLDSMGRLLTAVSASEANEVEQMRTGLLRVQFDEQRRNEMRKSSFVPTEGKPQGGLKREREVITQQPDVAVGLYQQAE